MVGRFTAVSVADLSEAGDETVVKYSIDANITGKLGSMGQPVLKSKAKEMEKGFVEKMRAAFAAGAAGSRPMTPFELAEPATLEEALQLLDPDDASVRPLGGGTALMLMMKAGVFAPSRLVSLRKITALKRIAVGADGGLVIGALTPLSDVEHSAEVAKRAGVIVRTMRRLSNVRVRNVATIGGNLAHGDPHMDLPPVLMALDAGIVVVGRGGERVLAVENLFAGYYETVLKPGELITELRIPAQGKRRAAYLKVTTGAADDWPALGVAVSLEADGKAVRAVRVVVSAATEKAIRLEGAEKVLSGATIDDAVLARAGDAAADEAETVADVRGSAAYKRELLRVYVRRAVRQAPDSSTDRERATDGDHIDDSDDFRRPGRPLAAAARSPREGHGAGRIHP